MPPILRSVSSLRATAAQTQYGLWVQGFDAEVLSVLGFTAQDYGLSAEYCFEIEFESREPLSPGVVGRRTRLDLEALPGGPCVHGVIRTLEALEGGSDGVRQRLSLVSPLSVLAESAQTRAFPDLSVPGIIEEVLEGHGWSADAWRLELQDDYPALELTVQCAENDLHFLKRLMARHGLYYRFEQDDAQAVLVIHDTVEGLPEAPVGTLPYIPLKGENRGYDAVHRLEARAWLLTESVNLRDYNPETPATALVADAANAAEVPGAGECRHWGEHLRDPDGAARLARLCAERLAWRRQVHIAHTDHRGLAPGMRLTLADHPRAACNITYTVVSLRISADQRAALPMGGEEIGPTFEAEVTLIPASVCFRPDPLSPPQLGRVSARIESPGGDYAHLDEHGRYHLRFDFDERDNPEAEASHAVRLAAPFAGDGYGFHFPLLKGTEVLVTFENNDPDRPVILGALHNHAQPSPVNAANASQNILRTPGGNELLMDDQRGAERIALTTRDEQHGLVMDATEGAHRLSLRTEQGDMDWYAGEGLTLECGADQTVQVGGDQNVTVEQGQRLVTKHAGIDYQAATDLRLTAKETVRFEAETADIAQRAERDAAIEAGRHMRLNARGGDMDCLVEQGAARIRAKGEIQCLSAGAHARLGTAGGAVSISRSGDIAFKGRRVTLEAERIDIRAGNIGLDMGSGVQMPGGTTTSGGSSGQSGLVSRPPRAALRGDGTNPDHGTDSGSSDITGAYLRTGDEPLEVHPSDSEKRLIGSGQVLVYGASGYGGEIGRLEVRLSLDVYSENGELLGFYDVDMRTSVGGPGTANRRFRPSGGVYRFNTILEGAPINTEKDVYRAFDGQDVRMGGLTVVPGVGVTIGTFSIGEYKDPSPVITAYGVGAGVGYTGGVMKVNSVNFRPRGFR